MDLSMRIANHCAPALAGLKPANLISCPSATRCATEAYLCELNQALNPVGIYFRCILCRPKTCLFLVYREEVLQRHLCRADVSAAMEALGYDASHQLLPALNELERRLASSTTFPHEIAYFLGYPVEDVKSFVEQQGMGYLCSGYWKVYHDAEAAQRTFLRFTCCRRAVMDRLRRGTRLEELFGKKLHAQAI